MYFGHGSCGGRPPEPSSAGLCSPLDSRSPRPWFERLLRRLLATARIKCECVLRARWEPLTAVRCGEAGPTRGKTRSSMQYRDLGVRARQIGRPGIHQPASALEQIGTEVGILDTADRQREGGYRGLAWLAGVGVPAAEARAERVNRGDLVLRAAAGFLGPRRVGGAVANASVTERYEPLDRAAAPLVHQVAPQENERGTSTHGRVAGWIRS